MTRMTGSTSPKDPPPRRIRLAYLVSHPIQYQAPLLRRIASEPDIDLTVFFASDFSVHGYQDQGFGVDVHWDVPLLDGYKYEFLPSLRDERKQSGPISQINHGILSRLRGFDLLWVHGYATANSLHGMLAARALGIPVLLRAESRFRATERNTFKRRLKSLFFQGLGSLVDAVMPIGTFNEAFWSFYLPDTPRFLMPYAVDNVYFQQMAQSAQPQRDELVRELQLDPSRSVILYASKLLDWKRCADLLEAYLLLIGRDTLRPAPYLVIVGDGDQRASLEERARNSGSPDIRFCGFRNQSELPAFFNLSSVFVLPSEDEQWGLIVNEVMNAGRPVILSDDIGCQPDLIRNGVEGYVYPVRNVAALSEALEKTLYIPGEAERLGRNALDRINQWSFEQDIVALRQAIAHLSRKGARP